MNVKQFKGFIKNVSETKATTALLGHSSICSMNKDGANVMYKLAEGEESSVLYLVKMEHLLDVSKKLKATKEDVELAFINGKLSISAGLAIYDIPAKKVELELKGNKNVVLTETCAKAETLKQFLITSAVVPQKDEAEFLPVSAYVHLFCMPDDIFTLESMTSVEDVRVDMPILIEKPIKGCFPKAELAKLAKPLKALGYTNTASVYLKRNGNQGAKLCIELRSEGVSCTLSIPLQRKMVDKPLFPLYKEEDGLVIMDEGSQESVSEQLCSLGADPTQKQLLAIKREFPDMVTVFTEDTHTVLTQDGLQHTFTSRKQKDS